MLRSAAVMWRTLAVAYELFKGDAIIKFGELSDLDKASSSPPAAAGIRKAAVAFQPDCGAQVRRSLRHHSVSSAVSL